MATRARSKDESDTAIGEFLLFLVNDFASRPHAILGFDATLRARLESLIGTVEVDLDAPLPGK